MTVHLYEHQQKVMEQIRPYNRCAVYVDMGGGKTFIGSEKMKELGNKVNLVICQKSKVQDWVDHFNEYYASSQVGVFNLTHSTEMDHFFGQIMLGWHTVIGVINYDLCWRRTDLLSLKDFTLMLDESSLIQNHSTKRTKYILKMRPANVILLSGTPTSGRYERLWTQMHLLGWPISRKLYEQTYVIWDYIETPYSTYRIPVVRGYKNVPRLKRKMAEYGCVFMKSEEFGIDLPDQQDIRLRIKSTPDYKRFMKHRYLQMSDGVELIGDTSLTTRLYARMLCGIYNKEKMAAVKDLIESTEDRLIIFYNFTAEMEALKEMCQNMLRPVSVVNGKVKDLRAYEVDSDSVTLIQYQAGAYGLNLQKCCRVIYFTLPESSELFEQSRKRIHRIGQSNKCFYYIPICQGSVEERIMMTLKERKDYTDALFKKDFE